MLSLYLSLTDRIVALKMVLLLLLLCISLVLYLIALFLFSYVFVYRCCIQTNCTHIVVALKFLFPNLYFKFTCRLHILIAFFHFKYSKNDDALLDAISAKRCIWFDVLCPSIICIILYLYKSFIIFGYLEAIINDFHSVFWSKNDRILTHPFACAKLSSSS